MSAFRLTFIPLGFASGIIPNPDISGLDSSTIKFQYVSLLELVFHYVQQVSVCFASETWDSLKGKGGLVRASLRNEERRLLPSG